MPYTIHYRLLCNYLNFVFLRNCTVVPEVGAIPVNLWSPLCCQCIRIIKIIDSQHVHAQVLLNSIYHEIVCSSLDASREYKLSVGMFSAACGQNRTSLSLRGAKKIVANRTVSTAFALLLFRHIHIRNHMYSFVFRFPNSNLPAEHCNDYYVNIIPLLYYKKLWCVLVFYHLNPNHATIFYHWNFFVYFNIDINSIPSFILI